MSQPAVKNSGVFTRTLFDGECIDLTDDADLQTIDNNKVRNNVKPTLQMRPAVNENAKLVNQQPVKTMSAPPKPVLKPTIENCNNKNIVVLSNQVVSLEKVKQHDGFVYVRPVSTTFEDTGVEEGDVVVTPSSKEIRSKKFPMDQPSADPLSNVDNDDDDVIFLPIGAQLKQRTSQTPNQILKPVQKVVQNAKPGSIMNKLSEAISSLKATQTRTENKILVPRLQHTQTVQKTLAKPQPNLQIISRKPPQKVVQAVKANPGANGTNVQLQQGSKPVKVSPVAAAERTIASYKPIPELTKNKMAPGPVNLPSLEKFGIVNKVGRLSREEVLKAVKSISKVGPQRPKVAKKTYVKIKQGDTVVVQNPFSNGKSEANEVVVPEDGEKNKTASQREDSTLSQIVIQNVYTADDSLFNSPETAAIITEDTQQLVFLNGVSNVDTVPKTPLVQDTPPLATKPNILKPQKTPQTPNLLIDPIRGSVIYNKAIQKHVKPGDGSPVNLSDLAETVSAVATITPNADGNTDGTNKGDVVFLLYPVGDDSESGSPFQEGQVRQVLALVPSDSKFAPAAPVPDVTESKKTDSDLMPPPMVPFLRNIGVNKPSPSSSKGFEPPQIVELDPPDPSQIRKHPRKDLGVHNTRRSFPSENYIPKPSPGEADLQELLEQLGGPPRKKITPPRILKPDSQKGSFRKALPKPLRKVVEPPVVTPVDILQIINRGKKPEIEGRCVYNQDPKNGVHFLGFTKREMRPASCLKEIKAIIKKDKTKITRLRNKMAAQDRSHVVYCGGASNYFLPEGVKTECEEEEARHEIEYQTFTFENTERRHELVETEILPTITEVVSKVNLQVLQMKQTRKSAAPANLSRTEEALQLIKKGLEMIQSWSQDDKVEKRKRVDPIFQGKRGEAEVVPVVEKAPRRRKQVIEEKEEEPVTKRGRGRPRLSKDGQEGGVKKVTNDGVAKKRGRKKTADDSDDDLLVVKRVDIIKNPEVGKRRGRRKKM
ncbi:hypothetical protein Zmor_012771 [Zophobas morio]|uniref:Uncharacterized protein n=1 Tax=Zophobas morio TaxID=2755281 RepID=A0AA38IE58_9CUCU|nr:hypothetical protein Zmor_012771 [Zophobas morio]